MPRILTALLATALFTACADTPLEPSLDQGLSPDLHRGRGGAAPFVSVFNQNLYVGANVDAVLLAFLTEDQEDDQVALVTTINELVATDFHSRAGAIARAIARRRPAVIGLQEVSAIDITLPPEVVPPAGVDIHLDFLPILETALADRGLAYDVAARVTNVTATLFGGAVMLVDEDVILVDPSQVAVEEDETIAQNFSTRLEDVAEIDLPAGVNLMRGFVAITGAVRGESVTFVNTHLEPDLSGLPSLGLLRAAQAGELLAVIGDAERVIMMGDLNDVPGSPMYQALTSAGFSDVWAELRPRREGLTCCHASDLSNRRADFDRRIDYVLSREIGHPIAGILGRIELFGDSPEDRLASPEGPIWPSDHAGLFAWLFASPARGVVDD